MNVPFTIVTWLSDFSESDDTGKEFPAARQTADNKADITLLSFILTLPNL